MNSAQTLIAWAEAELQDQYLYLLSARGGEYLSDSVLLYDADDVIERNETYESKAYCPGFLTIGDDGGGRAVVIALGKEPSPVYVVGHGSMSRDDFVQVAANLSSWVSSGAPVD